MIRLISKMRSFNSSQQTQVWLMSIKMNCLALKGKAGGCLLSKRELRKPSSPRSTDKRILLSSCAKSYSKETQETKLYLRRFKRKNPLPKTR